MNRIVIICCIISLSACSRFGQKSTYSIDGNLSAKDSSVVYLKSYQTAEPTLDSTFIINGKFKFEGKLSAAAQFFLYTKKNEETNQRLSFVLENENYTINGSEDSIAQAIVVGGKEQAYYVALRTSLKPIEIQFKELQKAYYQAADQKDTASMTAIDAKWELQGKIFDSLNNAFIKNNPTAFASLLAIDELAGGVIDPAVIGPLLESVNPKLLESPLGKNLSDKLLKAKKTAVGQPFIDFKAKDINKKDFQLSKVKSKYILLDFWASWCGPCRAENPFVVKAYEMYHSKGLAIVSVSLDDNESDWKAAVAKDHLNWIHVSSLKGFDEPAAKLYGISAIPQNFLIDSAGTIVAKDLRGDALAIALANCLK